MIAKTVSFAEYELPHLDRPDVSGTTKTDPVKTILSPAFALSTTSFLVFNAKAVSER